MTYFTVKFLLAHYKLAIIVNQPATIETLEQTRRLVLAYGWNSTSYQILNPGIRRWFSKKYDAVVGFAACSGVRVVAGSPVCAVERLPEIVAEFELDAARNNETVCYFCAEERLESIYDDSSTHAKILLGAQPVWNPANWAGITIKQKSLRAQFNRARNKGVSVSEWSAEKSRNHPMLVESVREWLAVKNLPPLHFLIEPNTLARIYDRRVFVAERRGEVVGFVMLSPVSQRNGWLFEQFIHRPNAPNGTIELLIDTAMRALAEEGFEYATLGLSPLSTRAQVESFKNPFWLRILLAWMRLHGKRFYNFGGLDSFKAKFQPEKWEAVFAVSNQPRITPVLLYAIASAFSGNAPFSLLVNGLRRAFITELKWLKRRFAKTA